MCECQGGREGAATEQLGVERPPKAIGLDVTFLRTKEIGMGLNRVKKEKNTLGH